MAIPEQELQPPTPDQTGEGFKPTRDAELLFELATGYPAYTGPEQYEFKLINERACSNIFSPIEKEAVQKVGEVVAWSLFEPPGIPIPDSLIRVANERGTYEIDFDPASGLHAHLTHEIIKSRFLYAGLGTLHKARVQRMAQDTYTSRELMRGMLEEQPEYQFLMSFNVQNPQTIDEAPLTPNQLLLRKKQIEQLTRERFSVPEDRPLNDNPAAAQYFARATYNLDEETQPRRRREEVEKTPIERLKDHYHRAIMHGFNKEIAYRREDVAAIGPHSRFSPEQLDEKIVYIGDKYSSGLPAIHTSASEEPLYLSSLDLKPFFPQFPRINKNGYIRPPSLSTDLYARAFTVLFSEVPAVRVRDFDEFAEKLQYDLRNSLLAPYQFRNDIGLDFSPAKYDNYLAWAKQPTGLIMHEDSVNNAGLHLRKKWENGELDLLSVPETTGPIRMSISSVHSIENRERQTRAWVLRRPKQDRQSRLITTEPAARGLPPIDYTQPDQLILSTPAPSTSRMLFPFVPGYQLAGWDEHETFAFALAPEQDPYRPADVLIPQNEQNNLGYTYMEIGLRNLGDEIQAQPELTVQMLTDLIAAHSHYETEYLDHGQTPRNLGDFYGYIKDEQLRVQCDGAANFLKFSLDQVFGEGSSVIKTGLVLIPDSDRIHAVRHAQVLYTNNGRQYMLDSTAASEDNLLSEPGVAARPARAARARAEQQGTAQTRRRLLGRSGKPTNKRGEASEIEAKLPEQFKLPKPPRIRKKAAKQVAQKIAEHKQTQESVAVEKKEALTEIRQMLEPVTNETELQQEQRAAAAKACRDLLESQLSAMLKIDQIEELRANINKLPEPNPLRRTLVAASKAAGIGLSAGEAEKLHDYIGSYQQATPSNLGGPNKLQTYSPELLDVLGRTAQTLLDLS